MSMQLDSKQKLFVHELKDIWSAERQLVEALPKVIDAVDDKGVRETLTSHLEETKQHISRIEEIFSGLDYEPGGVKCVGMEGLIQEGAELIKDNELPADLLTGSLVTGGKKIELYEITAYEAAIKTARELGHADAAASLESSLQEERNALAAMERFHG